jgi:hypothetical protein
MAITHEDIKLLKQEFDERYVLQSDCDNVQKEMNEQFSKKDTKLAVLDLKMTACLWLVGIIASGIIALVIRAYLG